MKQNKKSVVHDKICFLAVRATAMQLLGAFYVLCAMVALLGAIFLAGFDILGYATGRLSIQEITLADTANYALNGFAYKEEDANTLIATSGDPSLLLIPGQQIRRLRLVVSGVAQAAERDLYYHYPGMEFSSKFRVWPTRLADGVSYQYTLPFLTGKNVRLDLCDRYEAQITVDKIILNEPVSLLSYFVPSAWQLFWFVILPPLMVCAILWLRDSVQVYRKNL